MSPDSRDQQVYIVQPTLAADKPPVVKVMEVNAPIVTTSNGLSWSTNHPLLRSRTGADVTQEEEIALLKVDIDPACRLWNSAAIDRYPPTTVYGGVVSFDGVACR